MTLEAGLIRAPEIQDGEWINSPPLRLKDLRGRVVLIDFWDYTCVNCIRTIPYLVEWQRRYAQHGLTIIGVHAPEFPFAREAQWVKGAVRGLGIAYPVVLDNNYRTWTAYANRYWPAKYLIDKEGRIRYQHFGEGHYAETERAIQALLREIDPQVKLPEPVPPVRDTDKPGAFCYAVTPELYAGFQQGRLGNPEGYNPGSTLDYVDPGQRREGLLYVHGRWRSHPDHLELVGEEGYLALAYRAAELNAVLRSVNQQPVKVILTQDGAPLHPDEAGEDVMVEPEGASYVRVDRPRMYNLIVRHRLGAHELRLSSSVGLAVHAFTFVSCVVPEEELPALSGRVFQVE